MVSAEDIINAYNYQSIIIHDYNHIQNTDCSLYSDHIIGSCLNLTVYLQSENIEQQSGRLIQCIYHRLNACMYRKQRRHGNEIANQFRLCGLLGISSLRQSMFIGVQGVHTHYLMLFVYIFNTPWIQGCHKHGVQITEFGHHQYYCGQRPPWTLFHQSDHLSIAFYGRHLSQFVVNLYYFSHPPTNNKIILNIDYYGIKTNRLSNNIPLALKYGMHGQTVKHITIINTLIHSKVNATQLCFLHDYGGIPDELEVFDGPGRKSFLLLSVKSSYNCCHTCMFTSSGAMLTLHWLHHASSLLFRYNVTTIILEYQKRLAPQSAQFTSQFYNGPRNAFDVYVVRSPLLDIDRLVTIHHILNIVQYNFEGPSVMISDGIYNCQYGGLFVWTLNLNAKTDMFREWCGNEIIPSFVVLEGDSVIFTLWYSGYSQGHIHGLTDRTPCHIQSYRQVMDSPVNIRQNFSNEIECFQFPILDYNGQLNMVVTDSFAARSMGPLLVRIMHSMAYYRGARDVHQTMCNSHKTLTCLDTEDRFIYCLYSTQFSFDKFHCPGFALTRCILKILPCHSRKFSSLVDISRGVCSKHIKFGLIFEELLLLPNIQCLTSYSHTNAPVLHLQPNYSDEFYDIVIYSREMSPECTVYPLPTVAILDNNAIHTYRYKYDVTGYAARHKLRLSQAVITLLFSPDLIQENCAIEIEFDVSPMLDLKRNHGNDTHQNTTNMNALTFHRRRYVSDSFGKKYDTTINMTTQTDNITIIITITTTITITITSTTSKLQPSPLSHNH